MDVVSLSLFPNKSSVGVLLLLELRNRTLTALATKAYSSDS